VKGQLWTPEETERLRALVALGMSPLEVAAEFPAYSRNAILGRADRCGFRFYSRSTGGTVNKVKAARLKKAPAPKRHKITAEERQELIATTVIDSAVTLDELNDKICNFPVTDDVPFKFCGKEKQRGRYCEAHWAISHQSVKLARL